MSAETADVAQDPWIGTVIQDRYRVLKKLGVGGMGVVYLAEHMMIGRKVAIKTLHPQFATDVNIVQRFRREALAATAIGNEHVVDVTDMGHLPDNSLYMVLEFLDGVEFGDEIENSGAQSVGRTTRIVSQLCQALKAVHAAGIVHRDLKPENLFLVERGDDTDFVKVLDFGISKFREGPDGQAGRMTATGAALGTPYFMAPEQVEGRADIDHRADIYAVGGILYYALAGNFPFSAPTLPALFISIITDAPPSIRDLRPDVPEALAAVIARCMEKRPDARYQSAEEVRVALSEFLDRDTTPEVSDLAYDATLASTPPNESGVRDVTDPNAAIQLPSQSGPLPIQGRKSWGWVRPAVVLAVSGAAAAVFVASMPPEPDNPVEDIEPAADTQPTATAVPPTTLAAPVDETASGTARRTRAPSDMTVRVTFRTEPPRAKLFLDHQPIANPFDGELPQTKSLRVLEARLDGYEALSQELSLMFAQNVRLKLVRKGRAGRKGSVRSGAGSTGTPKTASGAAAEPKPANTVRPAVEPAASRPQAAPIALPASPTPTPTPAVEAKPKKTKRGLLDVL